VPPSHVGPVLALALAVPVLAGAADNAAPPEIGRPRPAPQRPSTLPPLPPAEIDNKLVIGGDDLRARARESRMTVEVHVNGRGPYHFVVDSGADTSVVGQRIAHDLELPLGTPSILNGTTARSVVDRVRVDRLTLGQTTFEYDVGADGLVGIDALVNQRLMMDFEKHVIKVEDARLPDLIMRDAIVITAKRRRGQLILTHVLAAGLPLDAIIDTGSEITIGNLALRDKLIRHNRDKFGTIEATGVTGVIMKLQMARIAELQLGPVTLRDIPIAFADVPPFEVFGVSKEPALLLGTDILETFRRVSLDFRARKVRFQLKRCQGSEVNIATIADTSVVSTKLFGQQVACQ
jgi:hypothetical protein